MLTTRWVVFSTKTNSDGGMQNPHSILPTFQWARALKLQARFTRQPAECGRWKASAHLHSPMYMAKINPSQLPLSTSVIYYCGQDSQESAFCFLRELCSALQCRWLVLEILLLFEWLSQEFFWDFFFFPKKVYASQVKQWSVSIGATYSCNWSSTLQNQQSLVDTHEPQGRQVVAAACMNCNHLGLSLEEAD